MTTPFSNSATAVSSSNSSGIGFAGLLTVAFVVLKLVGIISWSWWWVLSPLWISFALVLLIAGPIVAGALYILFKKG